MQGEIIEGYAAIFNTPDSVNDTILPGAFARTLEKGLPAFLWDHFGGSAGKLIEAKEDSKGLFVRAELSRPLGSVDGLSIGFRERQAVRDKDGRKLIEVELIEVSVCRAPLHPLARILTVKEPTDGR